MTDAPPPPATDFIHLRVHSAYSLLEGAIHIKQLPALCEAKGMPAVAVADSGNLFGALEFAETAAKAGLQPIIACAVPVAYAPPANPGERAPDPAPLGLYAQNERGYLNLLKLVSKSFLESGDLSPRVTLDDLAAHADGLICLTGGAGGPLGRLLRAGQKAKADALAERLSDAFPDRLYVEIQRHGIEGRKRTEAEEATEPGLVSIAYERALPLVATNEVFFEKPEMFEPHDALMCPRRIAAS